MSRIRTIRTRLAPFLLSLSVFTVLTSSGLSFQKLIPGVKEWSYEEAHTGFMGWVIDMLCEAGYATPKEGETFRWESYLSGVDPTDKPQKWDIVKFLDDKGESHGAMVEAIGNDGNVVVRQPLGEGMSIYFSIDPTQAVGYLRPHKAPDKNAPQI